MVPITASVGLVEFIEGTAKLLSNLHARVTFTYSIFARISSRGGIGGLASYGCVGIQRLRGTVHVRSSSGACRAAHGKTLAARNLETLSNQELVPVHRVCLVQIRE
jgi:hypothetical protein